MDNINISTSGKGKTLALTNGIKAYNKEAFENEIHKLTQTNAQLTQNKQNSDTTKAAIEADKNRLISKKNALILKREELRKEIATLQ